MASCADYYEDLHGEAVKGKKRTVPSPGGLGVEEGADLVLARC